MTDDILAGKEELVSILNGMEKQLREIFGLDIKNSVERWKPVSKHQTKSKEC